MNSNSSESVALLAPVPLEHLVDGAEICATNGKVAFGSMAFLVFAELDSIRKGNPVDVYIYASHSASDGPFRATWAATYVGRVDSVNGAHPAGARFRPPSTFQYPSDNQGHWAMFWEVANLHRLSSDSEIPIRDMRGWKHKTKYKKFFVPEGPMIIEHP